MDDAARMAAFDDGRFAIAARAIDGGFLVRQTECYRLRLTTSRPQLPLWNRCWSIAAIRVFQRARLRVGCLRKYFYTRLRLPDHFA
jgi:hypothetical protein